MNPGPTEEQFSKLLAGQSKMMSKLNSIEEKQNQLTLDVTDLKGRILSLEAKIDKVDDVRNALATIADQQRDDRAALTALTEKIDDIENRQRRNNLVFRGIEDSTANETAAKSEELILELCRSTLGITGLSIEHAHRIGAYKAGKPRPVIAKFCSFKSRQSVLLKAFKLKGTSYSISEDFSRSIRDKRKKLWDYARLNKQEGERAVLKYDTLYLRGKRFRLDNATGDVAQL